MGRDAVLTNGDKFIASATGSISSLSLSLTDSNPSPATTGKIPNVTQPIINSQLHQTEAQKNEEPKFLIIRITYETVDDVQHDGMLLYKSMQLYNSDRTSQVIRNALSKLNLTDEPSQWTLIYCLPDKEMVMQPNTNVFYAVDKKVSVNFLLRPTHKVRS